MVIRIIHTYHCRVQYFSLDPWGIVTSAGGYIHWRRSSHLNSTSAHHKPTVSPIQPPDISRTNCNAIVDFDAIQGPSWMPESNYSLDVTDDPSCPQWHVRASPTIPNQPHDFPLSLSDHVPGNGGFHRTLSISHTAHNKSSNKWVEVPATTLNQARTAHVASSIGRKTMNLIFHVTNVWFHLPAFPCIPRWLVPFPRNSTYDWFHFLNFPVWQTMSRWWWFLRPGYHRGMVSPSRLAAARWCGSSALTVTAEWRLHPDWQHPGDVVPPLWPSQLNGHPT